MFISKMISQYYIVLVLFLVFVFFLNIFLQHNITDRKIQRTLCTAEQEASIMKEDNWTEKFSYLNNINNKCELRLLKTEDVVACFENIPRMSSRPWLHFAFIGDSRIRQQFYNFLKVHLIF